MRVTTVVPQMQYAMQQSEQSLATALQQVSTGKRVNQLADDPAASARVVQSLAESARVDRYTANANTLQARLQTADAALSSVVTSLNRAVTLGTQGANGTVSASDRQSIATAVQGVLSDVVAQANTSFQGSYLFAGSVTDSTPFTADPATPDAYLYNGNSTVNQVQVGDGLSVSANVPGDQIFAAGADVLGSLQRLITALQSGTSAQIGVAATAITTALNYVGQQRAPLANTLSHLNAQESYLGQEQVTLTSQQNLLTGIDMAVAATNLSQAETQHSAVLAAAAKVLPITLLDYLK